jgi:hypothetical protein
MKNYPAAIAIVLIAFALISSLFSCSSKCMVRGRVVDAETGLPIDGAAVAIRWYTEYPDKQSAKRKNIDAVQALSNDKGIFTIPEYANKQYILGVYKNGYICWSSRDIFLMPAQKARIGGDHQKISPPLADGMEIKLKPLQNEHSRDLHAGFTVMVAGESTDSEFGPFRQSIQPEYLLWRNNLRQEFQRQVGAK